MPKTEDFIVALRKCRNCDDAVGMVNGEYVHRTGKYSCKVKSTYNELTGRTEQIRTVAE